MSTKKKDNKMNVQRFYVRLHPMCNKYYTFYTEDNNEESVRKRIFQSIEILQKEGVMPDNDIIRLNYKTQDIHDNFVFNGGFDKNTRYEPCFKNDEKYNTPSPPWNWHDINLDLIIDLPDSNKEIESKKK